jgi:hypothetical protein
MTRPTLHLDDLPVGVRARVVAQARPLDERTTSGTATERASVAAGGRWRCHQCGRIETAWAPIERHANDEHHGARVELLLDDVQ